MVCNLVRLVALMLYVRRQKPCQKRPPGAPPFDWRFVEKN